MTLYFKKIIADMITANWIGWCIGVLTKDRFKSMGVSVDTHFDQINPYTRACLFWGLYEKQEGKFVKKYLPVDQPVIELGGSLGVITSMAAMKTGTQQIYSIEANPALIGIIKRTLELNNLSNVSVMNLGIDTGQLFFVPGRDNTVGNVSREKTPGSIPVDGRRLSDVVSDLHLMNYSLISDIEGSEADFLFNDLEGLQNCNFMIIELHDVRMNGETITISQMLSRIKEMGFLIIDQHGPVIVASRAKK